MIIGLMRSIILLLTTPIGKGGINVFSEDSERLFSEQDTNSETAQGNDVASREPSMKWHRFLTGIALWGVAFVFFAKLLFLVVGIEKPDFRLNFVSLDMDIFLRSPQGEWILYRHIIVLSFTIVTTIITTVCLRKQKRGAPNMLIILCFSRIISKVSFYVTLWLSWNNTIPFSFHPIGFPYISIGIVLVLGFLVMLYNYKYYKKRKNRFLQT